MAVGASANEHWRLFYQVDTPLDAAIICSGLMGMKLFAPGEEPSCWGSEFAVDLAKREIRYKDASRLPGPKDRDGRQLDAAIVSQYLKDGGAEKLEALRDKLMVVRNEYRRKQIEEEEQAIQEAQAEKARAAYLADFEAANTLPRIRAFEAKYAEHDPDALIPRLSDLKERLRHTEYRTAYANATTAAAMGSFVRDYANYDPDRLLEQAKRKQTQLEKQEVIDRQQEERRQVLAAQQAEVERDRSRLQYIQRLHAKYSENILSETAGGRQIVMSFNIRCEAKDRRLLPLANILYATIADMELSGVKQVFRVKMRGQEARIYSEIYRNGKLLGSPSLYYELNTWGELRPVGISPQAVMGACAGSNGPLWVKPGEPDYKS